MAIMCYLAFVGVAGIAIAIAVFIGICLAIGWFPILMCAVDPELSIGSGFIGMSAYFALWAYAGVSAILMFLMIVRPDPDGLPPAWKFLAAFYTAKESYRTSKAGFSANFYAQDPPEPTTTYGKRMWSSVHKNTAAKMADLAAAREKESADYLDSLRERAEQAEALYRAEAKRNAAKDWKDKNG